MYIRQESKLVHQPILQQLRACNPRAIHHMDSTSTPTDMNFSSSPCIGNNDKPPTAPKITASGAVHAGHPGVNAANAPPRIADESVFTEFIFFTMFILNAIIAKLIPARADIPTVSGMDMAMYP